MLFVFYSRSAVNNRSLSYSSSLSTAKQEMFRPYWTTKEHSGAYKPHVWPKGLFLILPLITVAFAVERSFNHKISVWTQVLLPSSTFQDRSWTYFHICMVSLQVRHNMLHKFVWLTTCLRQSEFWAFFLWTKQNDIFINDSSTDVMQQEELMALI